ncbi:MAG: zf-HC2 domain-containing protein [Bacillota bacterium]|nr:zf-HC2 domain-containing protein [Bacillota bacterium]
MDCRRARRAIQEYLDGEASEEESQELSAHLEQCPGCKDHFREMSALTGSLASLALVDPGSGFVRDVMKRVAVEKRIATGNRVTHEVPAEKATGFKWMVVVLAWAKGAAVMAVVIFAFGMLSLFVPSGSTQARVLSTDPKAYVLVAGRDVQVPPTSTVHGNLTIVDGNLVIWGKVEGDVRVIRGTVKSSSGALVGGRIVVIDSPLAQAKDAVLGACDWFLSTYGRLVGRVVDR